MKRFIRFLLVGAVGFLVDAGVLLGLLALSLGPLRRAWWRSLWH